MLKTSKTHPLLIAVVMGSPFPGQLGVTFAPGKKDPGAMSGGWDRDLAADLDVIQVWKASIVVTLIEDHEFDLLGIPSLGAEIVDAGWNGRICLSATSASPARVSRPPGRREARISATAWASARTYSCTAEAAWGGPE